MAPRAPARGTKEGNVGCRQTMANQTLTAEATIIGEISIYIVKTDLV
jgi:hypothetical protein